MHKGFTLIEFLLSILLLTLLFAIIMATVKRINTIERPVIVLPSESPIEDMDTIRGKQIQTERFLFERQGTGLSNQGVHIVTDQLTGKKYLLIGSSGMIELK